MANRFFSSTNDFIPSTAADVGFYRVMQLDVATTAGNQIKQRKMASEQQQAIILPALAGVADFESGSSVKNTQKTPLALPEMALASDRSNGLPMNFDSDAVALAAAGQEDPEWLAKLEADLNQANQLEQDLQMLCALRRNPVNDKKEKEGGAKKPKNVSKAEKFEKTAENASSHHNSRVLSNLKVEGKNSFGIPCTDIYDDDFDIDLSFLLRSHRQDRFFSKSSYGMDNPAQSHLLISGTSFGNNSNNNSKMMSISSQMAILNRASDGGIIRDTESPLFADVTPMTPTLPKSRAASRASKRNKQDYANSTTPAPGDNASVKSAGGASSIPYNGAPAPPVSAALSQTYPVTHNSSRTSLLGGSLPTKPNKKILQSSLPLNPNTAMQVQFASSRSVGEEGPSKAPVNSADCSRSLASCQRLFAQSMPRLWVSPAWPKGQHNNKQPFKQLRRSGKLASSTTPRGVETNLTNSAPNSSSMRQLLASRLLRSNTKIDNAFASHINASMVQERKHQRNGDSDDDSEAMNVYETDYMPNDYNAEPTPTDSRVAQHPPLYNRRSVPTFHRVGSASQLSLGTILTAIRSANESLGSIGKN